MFQNAIIGGDGELVRDQVRSRNYVTGVSGWIIRRDGTAEFVGLIIRTGGSGKHIEIGAGGANIIEFFSGLAGETAPGYLLVETSGGPPADEGYVELAAPALGGSVPRLTLTTTSPDTNSNALLDSPGSVSVTATTVAEITGALINLSAAGDITIDPGSGEIILGGSPTTLTNSAGDLQLVPASGTVSLPNQGDKIKRGGIAAPSLAAGWSNFGGGFQNAGYVELPDHRGCLTGVITNAAPAIGTVLFTLPTQMRPASNHVYITASNGNRKSQVVVGSNGDVTLQNFDAGTTWVSLSDCSDWPISGF